MVEGLVYFISRKGRLLVYSLPTGTIKYFDTDTNLPIDVHLSYRSAEWALVKVKRCTI